MYIDNIEIVEDVTVVNNVDTIQPYLSDFEAIIPNTITHAGEEMPREHVDRITPRSSNYESFEFLDFFSTAWAQNITNEVKA